MFKRRFQTRHNKLDWREILIRINAAGMSYDSLGELLDKSGNSLRHIASKEYVLCPAEWDAAYALLDMYTMLCQKDDGRIDLPLLVPRSDV